MPGMAGPELVERLLTVRPETKVIFTSGYAESGAGLAVGGAYIPKPFTPAGLVAKVRQVLGRPSAAVAGE
jgi:CheY-like chemotaxis protein